MHLGLVLNTTEAIPNYPSLTRTTNLDGINDQSFTIDQFRDIRIDQVDDGTGRIPDAGSNPHLLMFHPRRDTDIWHCKGKCI